LNPQIFSMYKKLEQYHNKNFYNRKHVLIVNLAYIRMSMRFMLKNRFSLYKIQKNEDRIRVDYILLRKSGQYIVKHKENVCLLYLFWICIYICMYVSMYALAHSHNHVITRTESIILLYYWTWSLFEVSFQ
jgi:hypothetical protein